MKRPWLWAGLALGGAYLLLASPASAAEPSPPQKKRAGPEGEADVIDLPTSRRVEDDSEGSGSSVRAEEGR